MNTDMKKPPRHKSEAMTGEELAKRLECLIGREFALTDNPRTNGSRLRKLVEKELGEATPAVAEETDYTIVPFKRKGVPRLLAQMADSYIVTSGESYNLQVWNRLPNSKNVLVRYKGREKILCCDIRLIMVHVDITTHTIDGIEVATPQYIEKKFGRFGVPTMKYQLMISPTKRAAIVGGDEGILFQPDTELVSALTSNELDLTAASLSAKPEKGRLLTLDTIRERVASRLVGMCLPASDTKTRGQLLEREVATLLGYNVSDSLVGGYPDIPHQLLEIKVQDSPTVDLGRFSPSYAEEVCGELRLTTEDVRYLIALANPQTGIIEGIVLMPGASLCDMFPFVSSTSFKCQRSIPMDFFEQHKGRSVFNPKG